MSQKIKKLLAVVVCIALLASLAACSSPQTEQTNQEQTNQEQTNQDQTNQEQTNGEQAAEKLKIALICDVAGTQVFVLDMIDGFKRSAEKHGFEAIVVESADSGAFEDNFRAIVEEGVDLVIGGGWQSADPIQKVATEFPDKADYALIDSSVEAENVKCITFREQEGAYLIGQIAAMVSDEADQTFGAVHVTQGPSSFKWRWGYMEGVKNIKPDAKFVFNYVGNFNDPAKAKEYAIQQYEQGCKFINSAAAGGDKGVFEAAKEKQFYTSGQDVDLTSPDNPYVVTCQIKNTGATVEKLLDDYFSQGENWTTDNETYGVKEGAIGAVYVTQDSETPRSEKLTDEDIAKLKEDVEKIITKEIDLSVVPAEEEYEQ